MDDLYREVIIEHYKNPTYRGHLDPHDISFADNNPLCGDHIKLTLNVADDRIEAIAFEGHGCAICKASSSMMTGAVKGKTVTEAETLVEEFRSMTTGRLDPEKQPNRLGKLKVFAGVRDLPSRVKCAILPWHTLHAALHSESSISTEGEADPVPDSGMVA